MEEDGQSSAPNCGPMREVLEEVKESSPRCAISADPVWGIASPSDQMPVRWEGSAQLFVEMTEKFLKHPDIVFADHYDFTDDRDAIFQLEMCAYIPRYMVLKKNDPATQEVAEPLLKRPCLDSEHVEEA